MLIQNNTISIITICYNNLPELLHTIKSVDNLNTKPFEHIIIDGSLNREIKNYLQSTPQPVYRKWICEQDNGIGDAFNKGIKNATATILVMLNSGDEFCNKNILNIVLKTFDNNKNISWIHSKYKLFRGNKWVEIGKPFEAKKLYRGMRSLCHQTMFIKKELHHKYGLYNAQEKIGMDYDFVCRIYNEPYVFIEETLVQFAPNGISGTQYLQSLQDAKRIYEKHFGKSIWLQFWQIRLKFLHYLLQSPIGNFLYSIKAKLKLENM
ncbi:MAG: glycosyltransferase [Bacteroidetes bacterium]|nr:glycosyltransferase [Bacteroidota bacterium]